MPLTLVAQGTSNSRRQKTIKLSATPTGAYPAGGDPIDLTAIADPQFLGSCFPGQVPQSVQIENSPDGYTAEIVAGTGITLATAYKLKIFSAPNTELTAAAYPAGLTADSFLLALSGPNWGF